MWILQAKFWLRWHQNKAVWARNHCHGWNWNLKQAKHIISMNQTLMLSWRPFCLLNHSFLGVWFLRCHSDYFINAAEGTGFAASSAWRLQVHCVALLGYRIRVGPDDLDIGWQIHHFLVAAYIISFKLFCFQEKLDTETQGLAPGILSNTYHQRTGSPQANKNHSYNGVPGLKNIYIYINIIL